MPLPFLAQLAIGLALNVIGYLLMPRPKPDRPQEAKDMDSPRADAGRPWPVVFGSVTIRAVNNLGYWDKNKTTRRVSSGGKK